MEQLILLPFWVWFFYKIDFQVTGFIKPLLKEVIILKAYERVRERSLKGKIMFVEDAVKLITDGMTVACSGFTPAGYPKALPQALAKRAKKEKRLV